MADNGDFDPVVANRAQVNGITQIRIYKGCLYLAGVVDLYSRRVVGWSLYKAMHADVVLQALLAVVLKRKPIQQVLFGLTKLASTQVVTGDLFFVTTISCAA